MLGDGGVGVGEVQVIILGLHHPLIALAPMIPTHILPMSRHGRRDFGLEHWGA